MQRRRVVILGASFAGLAVALQLEQHLDRGLEIVVVSKGKDFVFLPSLIWVPFGLREKREISFPLADLFDKRRIRFVSGAVRAIELDARAVHTVHGSEPYDVLVIATGVKQDFHAVPGLGPPEGHSQSIFTWDDADRARTAFEAFLEAPGPVVIGSVQGASSFSPAYEFALNMAHHIERRGLTARCPITFVTPEPFCGHLGTGQFGEGGGAVARLMKHAKITVLTNARVEAVRAHEIQLDGGRTLPFAYAMLTPPFLGIDPVRACADIVDPRGLVVVDEHLRTTRPDVFAAGIAVSMPPLEPTHVPLGRPVNGRLSEEMGRVVAHNVLASLDQTAMTEIDPRRLEYTIDAGNHGASIESDPEGGGRTLLPTIAGHWAKVAYERYFLTHRRRGA